MKPSLTGSRPHPVITQVQHNTTLWIGHLQTDPNDHFAGQTFTSPVAGQLDNIQVFSSAVHYPGHLELSLHEFDPQQKTWGHALGHSQITVQENDASTWISFPLPPIELRPGNTYGFRLHTPNALIGLGEAATGNREPFTGQEWNGDSNDQRGHFYSYFNLAFKVECA